jgi:hypothetical protein
LGLRVLEILQAWLDKALDSQRRQHGCTPCVRKSGDADVEAGRAFSQEEIEKHFEGLMKKWR